MKKTIIISLLLLALLLTGCRSNVDNIVIAHTSPTENSVQLAGAGTLKASGLSGTSAFLNGLITLSATSSTPEGTALEVEYEGGSYGSGDGQPSGNSKRIRLKGYLKIEDIAKVEIGDGYQLAWFAYDKNLTFLGNGIGGWLTEGEDIDATAITTDFPQYAEAVYFTFAYRNMSNTAIDVSVDVGASQIKVYALEQSDDTYQLEIKPAETTPAETTPAETTPAETTPAETTPAETTPAETTPAETTPAETTPAETTPAPVETTPAPAVGTDAPAKTDENKGCGGVVASGVALVAILGAAIIIKKRD